MSDSTLADNGSRRATVPFATLDIAPENLRFGQPADAGIPQLADTMVIDGVSNQIIDLVCRPGKKGEKPNMILDGRRRWLALALAVESGRIADDFPVNITIETDPNRQLSATILTGTEREATHLVDIIQAIGAMRAKKLSTAKIAAALGYEKIEIERWQTLSVLPMDALNAMREGKITQRQAKLLTKVTDPGTMAAFIAEAMNGTLRDHSIQHAAIGALVTANDSRVRLATVEAYVAAGGRVERDLFGETPDALVDADVLQRVWLERCRPTAEALREKGITVMVAGERVYRAPDGFENLPYDSRGRMSPDQAAKYADAEKALLLTRNAFHSIDIIDDQNLPKVAGLALAQLDVMGLLHPNRTIGCAVLSPDKDFGVDVAFHGLPVAIEPAIEHTEGDELDQDEDSDDAHERFTPSQRPAYRASQPDIAVSETNVSIGAKSNTLHQRYTDVATRALIRSLADDPATAQILCVARLFAMVALTGSSDVAASASTIKAERYWTSKEDQIGALDGEVFDRLDAHRDAYLASGLRPIPWVAGLSHGERVTLLAELMAATINVREFAVSNVRGGARAEAVELADMMGHDITAFWTPDFNFFAAHSKAELIGILGLMGADDVQAASLKKDDLAAYVAEQAAERNWAPGALSFRQSATVIEQEDVVPKPTRADLAAQIGASLEPDDDAPEALADEDDDAIAA